MKVIPYTFAMIVGSLSPVVVHHPGRRRETTIDPRSAHIVDHLHSKGSLPTSQSLGQHVEIANSFLEPEEWDVTQSKD